MREVLSCWAALRRVRWRCQATYDNLGSTRGGTRRSNAIVGDRDAPRRVQIWNVCQPPCHVWFECECVAGSVTGKRHRGSRLPVPFSLEFLHKTQGFFSSWGVRSGERCVEQQQQTRCVEQRKVRRRCHANRVASGAGRRALVPPPSPGMRLNVHLQTTESDPF